MVRATRKDQAQEDLVSKKDEINQRTSKIIELLIETKNSWNGKPAPGIGVPEAHSLKEPLPQETISTMDKIVQMVQEVDSKLKEIENQQSGYHDMSRERESKKSPPSDTSLDLSSIASNFGTRFMSHIKAPFQFGDDDKWARLRLLRAAAKLEKHIEDMQGYILSSSNTAIPNAVFKARDMFHILDNEIVEPMLASIRKLPERPPTKEHPVQEQEQQAPVEQDYRMDPFGGRESDKYQPADIIGGARIMKNQLRAARDRVPSDSFKPFLEEYNTILRRISYVLSIVNNNYDEAEQEYRNLIIDMEDFINRTAQLAEAFQKSAITNNDPMNWLKRKNVELFHSQYNHMRSLRLKADDMGKEARINLDRFMDALEKSNINPASLSSYLKNFLNSLAQIYKLLYKLGDIHNSTAKTKNFKLKGADRWPVISEMDLRSLNRVLREIESMGVKLESLQELHG